MLQAHEWDAEQLEAYGLVLRQHALNDDVFGYLGHLADVFLEELQNSMPSAPAGGSSDGRLPAGSLPTHAIVGLIEPFLHVIANTNIRRVAQRIRKSVLAPLADISKTEAQLAHEAEQIGRAHV